VVLPPPAARENPALALGEASTSGVAELADAVVAAHPFHVAGLLGRIGQERGKPAGHGKAVAAGLEPVIPAPRAGPIDETLAPPALWLSGTSCEIAKVPPVPTGAPPRILLLRIGRGLSHNGCAPVQNKGHPAGLAAPHPDVEIALLNQAGSPARSWRWPDRFARRSCPASPQIGVCGVESPRVVWSRDQVVPLPGGGTSVVCRLRRLDLRRPAWCRFQP